MHTIDRQRAAVVDDRREQMGHFLRDRRGRLDPAACGFARGRRRTPGLRREEVAQLAGVSVTWYTWLEQGRDQMGVPSADALEGIASALRMDRAERDHLFLLAHGRPPPRAPSASSAVAIPASVRQLVDGITGCPVLVRTADTWDVVAWNHAARSVFGDYEALAPDERNLLRRVFSGPAARSIMPDWDRDARRMVAALRGGRARTGPSPAVDRLIAELVRASPAFARWWGDDHDVAPDAHGTKRLQHPTRGPITLGYSSLMPEATDGLTVLLFVPATAADRAAVEALAAG